MSLAYYGYPFLAAYPSFPYIALSLLLIFTVIISVLRALHFPPGERPQNFHILGILVIAAAVGFTLGIASRRSANDTVHTGIPMDRVIALSGILREDPRSLQSGSGLGILEIRECIAHDGLRASSKGRVSVFFPAESIPRLKEFGRGSELYIDGTLSSGSRGIVFNARSVHVVKAAPAAETLRTGLRVTLLEKFQNRNDAKYTGSAAPVWGSLASALLLGIRDNLDIDLLDAFMKSGCSHILALSGMHLAIISGVLSFIIRRPLGIRGASLAGAVFITAYVFIAGSQPSLVRSAIMYLIGALAIWGFLKTRALSLLSMALIIQLIVQSETGISLSFILSYLALAGMLTLGETLRGLFRGRLPELVNGSLSASLGAFVFTAPVVVFYFGSLKPVGIIAGLIIAPLSSVFMVLSLGALAAAFLPLPLWSFFDLLLTGLYRVMEFTVSLAGRVPGFSFSNPVPVLVVSGLIWLAVLLIKKQDDLRRSSVANLD